MNDKLPEITPEVYQEVFGPNKTVSIFLFCIDKEIKDGSFDFSKYSEKERNSIIHYYNGRQIQIAAHYRPEIKEWLAGCKEPFKKYNNGEKMPDPIFLVNGKWRMEIK